MILRAYERARTRARMRVCARVRAHTRRYGLALSVQRSIVRASTIIVERWIDCSMIESYILSDIADDPMVYRI